MSCRSAGCDQAEKAGRGAFECNQHFGRPTIDSTIHAGHARLEAALGTCRRPNCLCKAKTKQLGRKRGLPAGRQGLQAHRQHSTLSTGRRQHGPAAARRCGPVLHLPRAWRRATAHWCRPGGAARCGTSEGAARSTPSEPQTARLADAGELSSCCSAQLPKGQWTSCRCVCFSETAAWHSLPSSATACAQQPAAAAGGRPRLHTVLQGLP